MWCYRMFQNNGYHKKKIPKKFISVSDENLLAQQYIPVQTSVMVDGGGWKTKNTPTNSTRKRLESQMASWRPGREREETFQKGPEIGNEKANKSTALIVQSDDILSFVPFLSLSRSHSNVSAYFPFWYDVCTKIFSSTHILNLHQNFSPQYCEVKVTNSVLSMLFQFASTFITFTPSPYTSKRCVRKCFVFFIVIYSLIVAALQSRMFSKWNSLNVYKLLFSINRWHGINDAREQWTTEMAFSTFANVWARFSNWAWRFDVFATSCF